VGTYAIVRAGLGRDAGFFAGWTVLAVGLVFVPALLVAAAFLLQNFFGLVSPHSATVLHDSWVLWAVILGVGVIAVSYFRHPAVRLGPAVAHGHRRDDAA
jgi:amino acid transporter